jgi:hypothetical protein
MRPPVRRCRRSGLLCGGVALYSAPGPADSASSGEAPEFWRALGWVITPGTSESCQGTADPERANSTTLAVVSSVDQLMRRAPPLKPHPGRAHVMSARVQMGTPVARSMADALRAKVPAGRRLHGDGSRLGRAGG